MLQWEIPVFFNEVTVKLPSQQQQTQTEVERRRCREKPVYSGVITEECLGCGQSAAAAAAAAVGGGLLPCGGPPPAFVKERERERNREVKIKWAPSRPTHGSCVWFPLCALAAAVHSLVTRARKEFSLCKSHAGKPNFGHFLGG